MTERARGASRLAWAVAILSFALLLPGAFFGLPGKPVAGAWRVLAGEVPYRDFWTMYAPGQFYLVAGLLELFGRRVLAQAIATVVLRAASAALVYRIARQIGAQERAAAALGLLAALSEFEIAPELGSYPPASVCVLGALSLALAYVRAGEPSRLFRAGLLLGVAALFKHDVAAYAALSIVLGLSFAWFGAATRESFWLSPLAASARLLAVALLPTVPVALLLAWKAGPDAWRDLIVFPATTFPKVRAEPYPGLLPALKPWRAWLADPAAVARARDAASSLRAWILAHAPEVVFAAGASFAWRMRRSLLPAELASLALLLAGMPFYWSAAHVQQNTHFISMALLGLLAGSFLWQRARRKARRWLAAGAALYAAGLLIAPFEQLWIPLAVWSAREPLALDVAAGIRVSPRERETYDTIAAFVRANVPEGEPIHCGVARHDAIVISNPRFYYLCDRPCATRYHELHPGVTDREDVEREMIADLESKHVRCAILWKFGWPDEFLDDILRRRMALVPGTGSRLLDEYFRERFAIVLEVGESTVLWRKDAPPPLRTPQVPPPEASKGER